MIKIKTEIRFLVHGKSHEDSNWRNKYLSETGHHLDLLQTPYVPSVSRNLISLSRLDVSRFDFIFGHGRFNLYKNTFMVQVFLLMIYIH